MCKIFAFAKIKGNASTKKEQDRFQPIHEKFEDYF